MPGRRTKVALAGLVLVGIGAGIGAAVASSDHDDAPTPSRRAADRPCQRPYVELQPSPPGAKEERPGIEVVGRVPEPTALAFPRGSDRGLIASRTGELRVVAADGDIDPSVVLDLTEGTIDSGDGGLLAIAYDPVEPWLYVYRTTRQQDEELLAFPLEDGLPRLEGQRVLLEVDHPPSEQHHGGGMAFGPDGLLYLGLGDGGGLGDPRENAQDPSTLLGKILRIRPTPAGGEPYVVPSDNPFVGRDGHRPEIWALGVRNPFRLTFDEHTGDLWIGDVGQSCWEELNRLPAGQGGQNLGWDVREGTVEFEGGSPTGGETLEPEHAYAHRRGWCAIVVGPVAADGRVLHTDYCKGRLVRLVPGGVDGPPRLQDLGVRIRRPVGLVAGPDGTTWVLSLDGEVYRLRDE